MFEVVEFPLDAISGLSNTLINFRGSLSLSAHYTVDSDQGYITPLGIWVITPTVFGTKIHQLVSSGHYI